MAQKQKILTDSVDETSKKLDILKNTQKQVEAQFKKGDLGEDEYRAFQREIIKTENELNDLTAELKATEKGFKSHSDEVKKAEETLNDFKDKAKETGEKVKTGLGVIGTATVATAGYSLKLSTDYDKAFNTLITKTGASEEEFNALDEAMKNVYANNFGESMEDVAEAMATVKVTTNLTGKELEGVTEKALLMRDTFGFEVNESIRAVNSLMDQFGITADEAYNLIAQGAQKGLNQNDDLLDTINEYSVQFENAGYSAEDMFNMLANGVESGTWSVDKLGDAVKEFNIRMSDGSAKEAVEALGFSWEKVSEEWSKGGDDAKFVFDMLITELAGLENTTEGYGIGVGLLGTMYEDLGYDAVLALAQTDGAISQTSDALEKINETKYDDIGSAIEGLGRTFETEVILPLGEELKPVVEDAIEYVKENAPQIKEVVGNIAEKVGDFIGFLVDNKDAILSTIAGIGAGMIVWNVASTIKGVVDAVKAYKTANELATTSQAIFNAVLNANPIMLIATIIATVIVAIVTFIATNDEARAKIIEIWNKIKEVFGVVIDAIVNFFTVTIPEAFESFKAKCSEIIEAVKGFFSSAVEWINTNIIQPVANFFSGLWNGIKETALGMWTGIQEVFLTISTWINENIIIPVTTFFSNLWTGIKDTAVGMWEGIKAVFTTVATWFNTNIIQPIWNFVYPWIHNIKVLITGTWEIIQILFSTVATWFNENVIQPISQFFTDLWNGIKDLASSTWDGIVAIFETVASWFNDNVIVPVKDFFTSLWTTIKNTASDAWNKVKETWNVVSNWFKNSVITPITNFFKSLWDGIKNTASSAWTGIKNTWNAVSNWFKNSVITPVQNFFTGMWDKLKNGAKNAWTGVKNAFSSVSTWFKDTFSKAWQKVKDVFSTGGKIFTGIKEGIENTFKTVVNGIIRGINKVISIPFNKINSILGKIKNLSIAGATPFSGLISTLPIPSIPELWRGGVLKKGQVGLLEGKGTEAVVPLEHETAWLTRVAHKMNELQNAETANTNASLVAKIDELIGIARTRNSTIVLDTGVLVGETVDAMDTALGNKKTQLARGW